MPATFEFDRKQLLVFAALLEGCGYYDCRDMVKKDYVPQSHVTRWQDETTLEVEFAADLRAPDEVDPRRFALLRYSMKLDSGPDSCSAQICYRTLVEAEAIPESLSWDPAEPKLLRLHFPEQIPAGSCEPWPDRWADFQALTLIYRGDEGSDGGTVTGDPVADPDLLAAADGEPIVALGPGQALQWLEECSAGGSCEFEEVCFARLPGELWVDCPPE
jgi:hypothetical protein